ncbi:methyl-accepting chemotaxis protein [Spirochaetia bacterium]|nr:methyl-accepting chemotaxis protein [Spirochaetia bacterium]
MKLRTRLTIITSGMMIIVVVILAVVLLIRARTLQTDAAIQNMENMAGLNAQTIQTRYTTYYSLVQGLAQIMNSFEDVNINERRSRYTEMLLSLFKSDAALTDIFTVWLPNALDGYDDLYQDSEGTDESGAFIPRYTRDAGVVTLQIYDGYQSLLQTATPTPIIKNPEQRTINGRRAYVSSIIYPIIVEATKELVGVVGMTFDLTSVQTLITTIKPYQTGLAALYANDGTIVAHSDSSLIGQKFQQASLANTGSDGIRLIEQSIQNNKPVTVRYSGYFIQSYPFRIGSSVTSWSFIIITEGDRVLSEVRGMTIFAIVIATVSVVVAAIVILLVSNNVAQPIIDVSNSLKDISEGEGDLTKRIHVHAKDEVGELAAHFNTTMEKIRIMTVTIKQQSDKLFDIGNELSTNMVETASAINEITANIQSIQGRVVSQSASVTETSSTMDQISHTIDKLNGHIEVQSENVAQSSSAIEEMFANIQSVTQTLIKNATNVKTLAEASEIGRESLQEVAADIQEVARESEGLLEINAVMESIASQTNLLSMNAAIEAAHAGEAGKGFAVVADEIRKLAESSGEQSQTISTVLKKIHDSIEKITESTEAVISRFETIDGGVRTVSNQEEHIRNAMEEQEAGSQQILEAIGKLNEITQLVKDGATEMLQGSKEVIKESKNLESLTHEINEGMSEMASGAEQINSAVDHVNDMSNDNRENINVLVREVSRFKVE